MTCLIGGDCLENLETFEPNSIDLIFCDLPYGQTSCKWDSLIDLDQLWKHFMRIKKLNTPIIMTTTTKFGVSLINSAPKKCPFRYDLVWCKSAPCGFLSAKKMPMRKHEMIYVFYEKLPFYDLSSHTHKFIDQSKNNNKINAKQIYNGGKPMKVISDGKGKQYEPPLPTSLVKEDNEPDLYGYHKNQEKHKGYLKNRGFKDCQVLYDPPLPTSLIKENIDEKYENKGGLYSKISRNGLLKSEPHYDPPLPNSLLEVKSTRGKHSTEKPVDLMKWILKYYSKEGDVVLDPTMGSGSMGVACEEMKRNFIGIEKDEEIFGVAWERLNV